MHPSAEGVFTNDLTNVLENKVIGTQISVSTKSKTLFLCLENRDCGILFVLEALILTFWPAFTIADTFDLCSSVDAIRLFTTGFIRPSDRI
jgi:hypothetical protein